MRRGFFVCRPQKISGAGFGQRYIAAACVKAAPYGLFDSAPHLRTRRRFDGAFFFAARGGFPLRLLYERG